MHKILEVFGGVLLAVSCVVLAIGACRARRRCRTAPVLAPTILFALGMLLLSVGWLIGPAVPTASSDAIRSGTLVSAAVLGLYALWLNDQRRRTEQARLETERQRSAIEQDRLAKELEQLGMERTRIVDERFIKAIELLGDDSDRVRMGALILLEGLARTRPDLVPDILDQVCGYLRGPVLEDPEKPLAHQQERGVRLRAQRVLAAVLARTADAAEAVDVDLSGAELHDLRLTGGRVGVLRLDGARLTGPALVRDLVADEVVMTDCVTDDDVVVERGRVARFVVRGNATRIGGRVRCGCDLGSLDIESVDFADGVELSDLTVARRFSAQARFTRLILTRVAFAPGAVVDLFQCTFSGLVSFDDVVVPGDTRFAGVRFDGGLELNARFDGRVATEEALVAVRSPTRLPAGWRVEPHSSAHRHLVAAERV